MAVALAAAVLPGCVMQGDFGRMEPSNVNRYLGQDVYAHVPGFGSSVDTAVPLTADETEMRARAYTLVFTYAHRQTHDHWADPNLFVVMPFAVDELPDPHNYASALAAAGFRAPEARMNAIIDDIRADLASIDGFERAALDVAAADAVRLIDLERVPVSEPAAHAVALRVADNRQLVEQAIVGLLQKVAGYKLALGDAIVVGALASRAGAALELENIKRRLARLQADLRHDAGRYALTLPRQPACLERSIASKGC